MKDGKCIGKIYSVVFQQLFLYACETVTEYHVSYDGKLAEN